MSIFREFDAFDAFIIIAGAVAFAVSVSALAVAVTTESECLRLGYREASVDYKYTRYCVKREDQTDIVVPLAIARMNRSKP